MKEAVEPAFTSANAFVLLSNAARLNAEAESRSRAISTIRIWRFLGSQRSITNANSLTSIDKRSFLNLQSWPESRPRLTLSNEGHCANAENTEEKSSYHFPLSIGL